MAAACPLHNMTSGLLSFNNLLLSSSMFWFGKMKNLQDAVKAFSLVTKEIPEAKLNIYGSGEEEGP